MHAEKFLADQKLTATKSTSDLNAGSAGLKAVAADEMAGGQNEPCSHADTDTSFISYSYLPLINISLVTSLSHLVCVLCPYLFW